MTSLLVQVDMIVTISLTSALLAIILAAEGDELDAELGQTLIGARVHTDHEFAENEGMKKAFSRWKVLLA